MSKNIVYIADECCDTGLCYIIRWTVIAKASNEILESFGSEKAASSWAFANGYIVTPRFA